MQYLLIISQHTPYHSSYAKDALEAALSASNVEMPVKFVFIEDGIFQLLDKQNSTEISHKSQLKQLSLLPIYDVEDIYVVEPSNKALFQTSILPFLSEALPFQIIDNASFAEITNNASQVLVF